MKAEETITYKEIGEQAVAVKSAYEQALSRAGWVNRVFSSDVKQSVFIGSGSSYYQAQTMAATFRSWLHRDALSLPSCDLLLIRHQVVVEDRKTVVFGVSRSGESTEVVKALEAVKEISGWQLSGITCYGDSRLAQLGDVLVSEKGQEHSVVMTKSLSSMIMGMQTAIAMASDQAVHLEQLRRVVETAPQVVKSAEPVASAMASNPFNKTVFLGMGGLFGLAQEGCLKLKEMSNVWTESYNTLEFRHGPKSIIDQGSCVIVLLSEQARSYEVKVAQEMKGYGAYVVIVTARAGDDTAFADEVFEIGLPDVSDEARSVLYLPLLQYYGMFTALSSGLNPDQPKNLTQVVTFE